MSFPWSTTSKIAKQALAVLLVALVCGAPQLIAQTSQQTQSQSSPNQPAQSQPFPPLPQRADQPPQSAQPQSSPQQPSAEAQPQSDTTTQTQPAEQPNSGVEVDPSKGPLQPAQPAPTTDQNTQNPLPNAPSSSQPAQAGDQQAQSQQQPDQKVTPEPQGTAVAGESRTAGGPASKPAGTAIAPAKQRQVRSWVIKLGLIAAGGAAIGTVYALTRSTSSTPPNANTAGATQAH